jgi:hypothetical protein
VKLKEGDIEIDFQGVLQAEKFDDARHGMSHCLKAVDFLCDWGDDFWLVELKDPEESAIPPQHKSSSVASFTKELSTEVYFRSVLAQKLKDTILYLHLDNRLPNKSLKYIVLVGLATMDAAMMLNALDRLKKACGDPKKGTPWQRAYTVVFLNLAEWNKRFPHCPAQR